MKSIKYKLLGIIYILFLTCAYAYPMSLYEGEKSGLDLLLDARGFYNSDANLAYYTDGSLFYHYDLSNDLSLGYMVSAMYDQSYDHDTYKILGENYLTIDNAYLGTIDIGTTPTVYYNGFLAGWLDWGYSSGYEIIDSNRYSDYLALRNASRSLFYTYQLHNMKLALQLSGHDNDEYEDSLVGGSRNYGLGSGFVYALGPLSFSTSYLVSNYDRENSLNLDQEFSTTQVFDAGVKFQYAGIYSVLGFFYDKNRWALGNESIALNYILRYDNQQKSRWVPQVIYGVREYVNIGYYTPQQQTSALESTKNMISDNYIYLSLAYYFNYHFSVYVENKIDIRSSNQIKKAQTYGVTDKDERDNMIGIGLSYELF